MLVLYENDDIEHPDLLDSTDSLDSRITVQLNISHNLKNNELLLEL